MIFRQLCAIRSVVLFAFLKTLYTVILRPLEGTVQMSSDYVRGKTLKRHAICLILFRQMYFIQEKMYRKIN